MATGTTQRMIRRTWRRTSEKICTANALPPGYRIVLIGEDDRVKRDDFEVRSGDFAAYPADFEVSVFLEEVLKNELRGADLGYRRAELRDQRDQPVSADLTLREVRDLPGKGGRFAKERDEAEAHIGEMQSEIEDALSIFEDDFRLTANPNNDIMLKALMRYIVSHFDREAVVHVLNNDEVTADLNR